MTILACTDLIFGSRIREAAISAGKPFKRVTSSAAIAPGEGVAGSILMVDLGQRSPDPIEVIRTVRTDHPAVTIVAFGPHVDAESFRLAREAGAHRVMARSAFAKELLDLVG